MNLNDTASRFSHELKSRKGDMTVEVRRQEQ